jgi:hypothetical protein
LFRKKAKFLGKIVSGDSLEVDPDSIAGVKNWPRPTRTKDVESFLGFVNYHREHLPHLADMAAPLYGLTGKAPFLWLEEHEKAFNALKEALLSPMILGLPREEGTFILDTDASDLAVGAQLSQLQDGITRPISFASKRLTPPQRKYCVTRKELLAIVTFTRQFKHYLLGRQFLIRTDHNSLAWLMRFKNPDGQLARWLEELSQYDMRILHRPGKQHENADALSRQPENLPGCDCYQAGKQPEQLPCGGCGFCQRAHQQWARFEEEVDDVLPLAFTPKVLTVLQVRTRTGTCSWAGRADSAERAAEQDKDPKLKLVKYWLQNNVTPTREELARQDPEVKILWARRELLDIRDGVLWYIWKDTADKHLYVVPKHQRSQMLDLAHNNATAGHLGIDKTKARLREVCFWTSQSADIRTHVASCHACASNKHLRRKFRAPLSTLSMGAPMERIHLDILGPLPTSRKGNSYVLLMVDQFTKWVEAVALPDQTAESVARAAVDCLFT